jgi:branched-chain amino acid aminotransferase
MSNTTALLDESEWLKRIAKPARPHKAYAMYSTWWDGIVTDEKLMLIPIDDHQVHRGDAVFEAFRVIDKKPYLLREHLDRLERSSQALGLKWPLPRAQLIQKLLETIEAAKVSTALVRLFLGRGAGSFSANPYDTLGEQLHLVVTEFTPPPPHKTEGGVKMITSKIKAKDSFWAQIKSCNYLVNVLMKKEAVDHQVDFTVGVDDNGHLTEGSTENLAVVTKEGVLTHPRLSQILSGCTLRRCFEWTPRLQEEGLIQKSEEKSFTREDLLQAREVMMIGTTLDVLSVVGFDGTAIGNAQPGPVAKRLKSLLLEDQATFTFLP